MIIALYFYQDPTSTPEHPTITDVTQRLRRVVPSLVEVSRNEDEICWTTVRADEDPSHAASYRRVATLVKRLMHSDVIDAYRVLYEEYIDLSSGVETTGGRGSMI